MEPPHLHPALLYVYRTTKPRNCAAQPNIEWPLLLSIALNLPDQCNAAAYFVGPPREALRPWRVGESLGNRGCLIEHSAVAEAAVEARQGSDELQKLTAWVVLRQGFSGTPELARELQDFVVSRLPGYKRPRHIEFVQELLKTSTGKIQRFKLREPSPRGGEGKLVS